jgi:YesN/AraC family two-component response regulator
MVCSPCHPADTYQSIGPAVFPVKVDLSLVDTGQTFSSFDLFEDTKSTLVRKIKSSIIEFVRYSVEPPTQNLSVHLSSLLRHNYVYMSNLFSEKLGITIEKFYICHKIERVKEFLIGDELNLTEIAFKLHYSSPAHLSSQFKKITGLTPSRFKQQSKRRDLSPQNT